jgi:hypothetical protein
MSSNPNPSYVPTVKLSLEATAIGYFTDNPDASQEEIAAALGVSPSTICRLPRFSVLWELHRAANYESLPRAKRRERHGGFEIVCDRPHPNEAA